MHRAIVNNHNKTTNMQKTVITQAIKDLKHRLSIEDNESVRMVTKHIIAMFEECVAGEREQIEQAYMDGRNDVSNNDGISPADYFTSKYGKDDNKG